jgi:polysaccharide export outer membrane protein
MTKSEKLTVVLLLTALAGCSTAFAQQAVSPATPAQTADAAHYLLGPDDQLKIWALGVDEMTDKPVRVDPGGDIDLPLIGKVHAGGLTQEQLKAELVQRFSKELLKPQVSVELVEYGSQPVSVMGAVNHPGVYQIHGRKTLAEVISSADGLRPDAGPRIVISRKIQNGPIPLRTVKDDKSGDYSTAEVGVRDLMSGTNPTDNILILPQDVITVPTADSVFVVGEVHKPGEVVLKNNATISVLQALSTAEGFGPTPSPQNSKIVRVVAGSNERQEIPVDLKKVLAGKAEDIALRPNDILVVPPNVPRKVMTRALEAAVQTATGVAIWRLP